MKKLALALFTTLLWISFASTTKAQVVELRLPSPDASQFTRVDPTDIKKTWAQPDINISNQLFIEGFYQDFNNGDKGVIILVKLSTPDGFYEAEYPAVIINAGEGRNNPVNFPIYGPWFYQGDEKLNVSIKMITLEKERAKQLRDKFEKIVGGVTHLLPVIPGLSSVVPFVNTGLDITRKAWDFWDSLASENKTHDIGSFTIERRPINSDSVTKKPKDFESGKLIGTYERWYVMTNDKYAPAYNVATTTYPITSQGVEGGASRPVLPNVKDARVLLIRVRQRGATTSMKALGDRLAKFFEAKKTRFEDAKILTNNPFQGTNLAKESHIARIFSSFLSFNEASVANGKTSMKEPVMWLVKELYDGQESGDDTSAYARLSADDESRLAASFNRFFTYKKVMLEPATEEKDKQGFSQIRIWRTWLQKRDAGGAIQWDTAKSAPPYATISADAYALKYAQTFLPTSSTDETKPANYNLMGTQIDNLRKGLSSIFRPTNSEPFMLYEQQAAADWIRSSFSNLTLDGPGAFASKSDVEEFARKLDQQLGEKKVVIYDKDSKKARFPGVVSYALQRFNAGLGGIPQPTEGDQITELQKLVETHILPARRKMSAGEKGEQAELDQALSKFFSDNVTKSPIGTVGYTGFFEDNLFTVNPVNGTIETTQSDVKLTKALRFWRGVYRSPETFPTAKLKEELIKPIHLYKFLESQLNQAGLPITYYRRVIAFGKDIAPELPAMPADFTPANLKLWLQNARGVYPGLELNEDAGKFGKPAAPMELLEISNIAFNYAQARSAGIDIDPEGQQGLVDLQRLAAWFGSPNAIIREEAKRVLNEYVALPPEQNSGANPYLGFVKFLNPRWREGKWVSGLVSDIDSYQEQLRSAKNLKIKPQNDRQMLEDLVLWFNDVTNLAVGVRVKARTILEEFVDLPSGTSASEYRNFLDKRNPQWIDLNGRWCEDGKCKAP